MDPFSSVIELKKLHNLGKEISRNHMYTGKVTAKITESLLSLVGIYFQRRL